MHRFWLLSLVFALVSPCLPAQSFLLYGVIGDTLVTLDTQTGDATTVGYIGPGFGRVGDLVYHPPTDQLLGVGNPTTDPELLSFDRSTGLATAIGMVDMVNPNLDLHLLEAMAYDDVSGQVYAAVHELGPASNWYYSRRFGTVDIANGDFQETASVVGTCQNDFDGMDFDGGTLYAIDGCPSPVNFCVGVGATGSVSFVGNTGTGGIADLAVEPNTGVIFGPVNQSRQLVTINPATGSASVVGTTHTAAEYSGAVLISLAFAPEPTSPIQLNVSVTDVSCFGGNDGSIIALGSSSNPPIAYSLNGSPFVGSGVFTGLTAGNYTLVVQDVTGSDTTVTISINEPSLLQLSATTTMAACANENAGSVLLQGTGGTPSYLYSLDGMNFSSSGTFQNLSPGPYTGTVQDQNGCLTTVSFVVVDPPALQLSFLASEVTCPGVEDGSVLFVPTGGAPGYAYSLDGVSYSSQAQFNGLPTGTFLGHVQDQNGCIWTAPFTIGASAGVELSLDSLQPGICPGDLTNAFASASGGTSPYSFNLNGGTPQSNGQFAGLQAGLAEIFVSDQVGCLDTLALLIPEIPALDAGFVFSTPACTFPTQINFVSSQSNWAMVNWDFGNGTTADSMNATGNFTGPDSYTVELTVEDGDGCQASSEQVVQLPALPIAGFASIPVMPGQVVAGDPVDFYNQSEFASQWIWDFGDGAVVATEHPTHVFEELGEFCTQLIAINDLGCRDTVFQCAFEVVGDGLFIPSAFSPNGDDLNDRFEIVAGYNPEAFHLLIFNRWGQLVFESNSLPDFWDAKFKGMAVPEGVYTWRVDFADPYGKPRRRQGTVTVIR